MIPPLPTTWPEVAAFCGVITAVGGMIYALLRWKLQGDFVTKADKADIAALGARLDAVENRLAAVPSHDDFRHLAGRVGQVERQVDVVAADVRGITSAMARVERHLDMLVQHHLPKGKDLA
ncbi:DUF2730 family protein [Pseudoroseomonas cervicalis]|uniref:DUF2730 family protein n=1 Tax=Pseudoroseomonas cervicalis ATCC 49957 TaxID=525371 RepID=D5RM64_9PROT|nr:DUF2730 family protein [Pseudoroseomonas cervicalis]EFH11616.1 hypothetical protein HMPREF0731_2175 [Pseudoroseomonas cervicalis ATCC 49957]